MAKATLEIKSLARAHTAAAIKTLAGIMNQAKSPAAARVAAAQALLDRGWGKAAQDVHVSGADGGPIEHRHRTVSDIDALIREELGDTPATHATH